jgi:hypothetical protein
MKSILVGIVLTVLSFLAFGPDLKRGQVYSFAPRGLIDRGSGASVSRQNSSGSWWPLGRANQAGYSKGPWPDSVLDWPGFGTVEQCRPTRRNPRYSCIPVWAPPGGVPSIAQLGAGLPAEWEDLPPLLREGGGQ